MQGYCCFCDPVGGPVRACNSRLRLGFVVCLKPAITTNLISLKTVIYYHIPVEYGEHFHGGRPSTSFFRRVWIVTGDQRTCNATLTIDSVVGASQPMQTRKHAGSYFTPIDVVHSLLRWAVRSEHERLLDPSCGDGRFIAGHHNSVGIEQDASTATTAISRAPWALVHEGDFFTWANNTCERFECAAGNPPFIRYQTFKGEARQRALRICADLGAHFTGLTSSWAPFLVVTASLLKNGGRMAFVVPSEIGHAPYAAPLLEYLVANFATVHVIAIRRKIFSELSEDCWLLYADGFGLSTNTIRFSVLDEFRSCEQPPSRFFRVSVDEWRTHWKRRLRPYLMRPLVRELYRDVCDGVATRRFGDIARIGIGYVSGGNEFFHLRPSEASQLNIPSKMLIPSVRRGGILPPRQVTKSTIQKWYRSDEPMLLLRLKKTDPVPREVVAYLDSDEGKRIRQNYKCRTRQPWYSVPDVQVPDFFLSYMSGISPKLARNVARCTCTNSVHGVRLFDRRAQRMLAAMWTTPFVQLSCEIEGHPLGGGMLKLEPREAAQVVLPTPKLLSKLNTLMLEEGLATMRSWRHYAT